MLNHNEPSEEEVPIPQRRVTPEELKRSLAALDARKQAEQDRLAATLSVGQAVEDLSLDYTPEEVWQEVVRQREAMPPELEEEPLESRDAESVSPEISMPYLRPEDETTNGNAAQYTSAPDVTVFRRLFAAGIVIVGLLVGIAAYRGQSQLPVLTMPQFGHPSVRGSQHVDVAGRTRTTLDTDFYQKLDQSSGPNPHYHIVAISPFFSSDVGPDEILYPARAIPDGYSIYAQSQISNPSLWSASAIVFRRVDAGREASGAPMPLSGDPGVIMTRYDGQQYLRCWILQSDIPAYKASKQVKVYLSAHTEIRSDNDELRPFTIPCNFGTQSTFNALMPYGSSPMGGRVLVRGLTLSPGHKLPTDKHTWENFLTMQLPPYQPAAWTKVPGALSNRDLMRNPYYEFDGSSDVESVGDLRDGQVFHCGRTIFERIIADTQPSNILRRMYSPQGIPLASLSDILIDARPSLKQPYTLAKIDGQLYLRGWVENRMTDVKMRGHYIVLHSNPTDPELGDAPKQLQVRMNRCMIEMHGLNMQTAVPLTDIHLDRHAWEHWKN